MGNGSSEAAGTYLERRYLSRLAAELGRSGPTLRTGRSDRNRQSYRLRKFRYEIVPGFWSGALLYEPDTIRGKIPAILNVIGHEPNGNAAEYEQKRCINFAKRGMLALSLSWVGFGQFAQPKIATITARHWT